jgi:hypothetical protein
VCALDRDLTDIVRVHAEPVRIAREAARSAAAAAHTERATHEVADALAASDPGTAAIGGARGLSRPGVLPDDVLVHLSQFVGLGTLLCLRAVCRTLRAAIPMNAMTLLRGLQNATGAPLLITEGTLDSAVFAVTRTWLGRERQMTRAARGMRLAAETWAPTYASLSRLQADELAQSLAATAAAAAAPVVASSTPDDMTVPPFAAIRDEVAVSSTIGADSVNLDDWRSLASAPHHAYAHGYAGVFGAHYQQIVAWSQDSADRGGLVQLAQAIAERQEKRVAAGDGDGDGHDGDALPAYGTHTAAPLFSTSALDRFCGASVEHAAPLLLPVSAADALEAASEGDTASVDPRGDMSVITYDVPGVWYVSVVVDAFAPACRQFIRDRAALRKSGQHVLPSLAALTSATSSIGHIEGEGPDCCSL